MAGRAGRRRRRLDAAAHPDRGARAAGGRPRAGLPVGRAVAAGRRGRRGRHRAAAAPRRRRPGPRPSGSSAGWPAGGRSSGCLGRGTTPGCPRRWSGARRRWPTWPARCTWRTTSPRWSSPPTRWHWPSSPPAGWRRSPRSPPGAGSGCWTPWTAGWPTRASGRASRLTWACTRRRSATGSACCATCSATTWPTRSAGSSWGSCCTPDGWHRHVHLALRRRECQGPACHRPRRRR